MKPRAAWPILAKKAKEKCDQAMAALVKGREKSKALSKVAVVWKRFMPTIWLAL